jgi:cytoskeletal protein CcmA (bactofilin family)
LIGFALRFDRWFDRMTQAGELVPHETSAQTDEGTPAASSLTLEEGAVVHGDICIEDVIVEGRVEGSIRAGNVHLRATALILGDVTCKTLAIATGALLEGDVRRRRE